MNKQVQISQELFLDLVRYHCLGDTSPERSKAISKALETKIDKLARHNIYSASKTAETPEEREKNRQKYLDLVGIHKDFRY